MWEGEEGTPQKDGCLGQFRLLSHRCPGCLLYGYLLQTQKENTHQIVWALCCSAEIIAMRILLELAEASASLKWSCCRIHTSEIDALSLIISLSTIGSQSSIPLVSTIGSCRYTQKKRCCNR